jgi:hypothetical protein
MLQHISAEMIAEACTNHMHCDLDISTRGWSGGKEARKPGTYCGVKCDIVNGGFY